MPNDIFNYSKSSTNPNRSMLIRKHKPPSCSSLMARSFRLHARLCQLCGCFFVRDIFRGVHHQARMVRWKSLYALYSCGCVSLLALLGYEELAAWTDEWSGHQEHLEIVIRITLHAMLFLRIIVNYLCMLLGSSKLASFYQRASAYETRAKITSCECCATMDIFWCDLRRCFVCILYSIAIGLTEPRGSNGPANPLTETFYWFQILLATLFWLVYDSMYAVALKSSGQVLCRYIDQEVEALRVFEGYHCIGFDHRADMARRAEEVRLNVFTVLQLKREINAIWMWSLIVTSVYVLLLPCICIHEVCYSSYAAEQRYGLALYAVYIAYDFATLTHASQSLINRAKELKNVCRRARSFGNAALGYQIQLLYDTINPEDMAFEGADFFRLKVSLLVSMTASVITYAVILRQTSQGINRSRDAVV
ncbi:uncharacterized protein [Dermacentor albipictus]|uniref:uncharacterized protein isoform X3 n=1 Tax=Dermacentor albipictus TaxID=60249 RepID=UPI0031FCB9BE